MLQIIYARHLFYKETQKKRGDKINAAMQSNKIYYCQLIIYKWYCPFMFIF